MNRVSPVTGSQDKQDSGPDLRALTASHDWALTTLGARSTWPRSLETVLDLMLSSNVAMCIGWGPDLTFFYNDAYVPFLGARHPGALGRRLQDVWPDIEPAVKKALAGESIAFENMPLTMTRHGHPEETWWSFAYSPLRDDDGNVAGFLDIATDTTANVRIEQELTREREQLRLLNADLEAQIVERARERATTWTVTSELLSVIDLDTGAFDRVNPAWESTLGWTPQQMEGSPFADFLLADDHLASAAAFEEVREGNPVLRFDNRYRTKDGDVRWLSWVAVPFEGKLYSSARDITSEHRQAENLAQAENALRQAQKMEAVGQLTGGVAHDFNNLLTVIRGSVDLLRRSDLTSERRDRYIDAIGETADRAAKLTGQLLAFARRQALKPETFDCGESIRDVVSMVRTLTGSRIAVETIVPDDPCFVLADKGQFETAIVNMCINARDAMDGEGRLTIVVGPVSGIPAIRAHPPIAGDFVAVTITDTGPGIAPEVQKRMFEPFFTTKSSGQGTGLGLSQVIGFAKQSGGDVRVDSGIDGGAIFTIYMPRVAADGSRAELEDDQPLAIAGDGVCVLIVEDNSSVGEFAVQALAELGYDTVLASDGDAALAELAKDSDRFHIVFSDVVMPGMTGLELAQVIRQKYPRLPVILTSGYSHVLAQNGRHGFELLHKPYSIEQLSRVFRKSITWQAQR